MADLRRQERENIALEAFARHQHPRMFRRKAGIDVGASDNHCNPQIGSEIVVVQSCRNVIAGMEAVRRVKHLDLGRPMVIDLRLFEKLMEVQEGSFLFRQEFRVMEDRLCTLFLGARDDRMLAERGSPTKMTSRRAGKTIPGRYARAKIQSGLLSSRKAG
ncbi:hypothetical protein [Rhodovulum viride]|uniref:hypothetical protein n=1 Tax=Rhodovulum viride TaxID=1231134 RepID=UPI0011BDD5BC|nr:hypothetical protein [Rhodovulum viride]